MSIITFLLFLTLPLIMSLSPELHHLLSAANTIAQPNCQEPLNRDRQTPRTTTLPSIATKQRPHLAQPPHCRPLSHLHLLVASFPPAHRRAPVPPTSLGCHCSHATLSMPITLYLFDTKQSRSTLLQPYTVSSRWWLELATCFAPVKLVGMRR